MVVQSDLPPPWYRGENFFYIVQAEIELLMTYIQAQVDIRMGGACLKS